MHLKIVVFRLAAILCLAGLALPGPVCAQSYPAKPVKIIVPFPPGGPADVLGRIFADRLGAMWSQPVVVDNRAGAAGNIGSEVTAKSAADGYTVLLAASSHVTNGGLYSKLPYDPIKDFTPISQVAYYSLVLVAHPSVAASSLKELIELAKANPGKLSLASAGNGTPTHLTAELFRRATGIDFLHVPYRGAAPATNDLLAGQAQLMFNNPVSALPQVRAGRLRALATTGAARSPIAPEIPTVAESGYPGFEAGTWYAFLGPAGIPREIVIKLSADIMAVLQVAEIRARFAAMGVEPIGTTPEQLTAIMHSDLEKWTKVIRAADIKVD
ncbi:MAG: tripartite tricarboxylate transporter substrate binding protein [Betaproteobacteria bacterium]|nr:tripartite tricarboxylate transporter substrate binding protein [Betaproteobacteria bacterium]